MGSDIEGWVETLYKRQPEHGLPYWVGVVKIDSLVERNYGMFGSLFGHRNVGGFAPIAAGRGLPDDASDVAQYQLLDHGGRERTWISWEEIKAINWEEEGEEETLYGQDLGRRVQRKDALTSGWATLFTLMEDLADAIGPGKVRLVVWFDSE
jgi:hypothetical protein